MKKLAAPRHDYSAWETKFHAMHIAPTHQADVDHEAMLVKRFKPMYDVVAKAVGVPWFIIGVIDALEGSFNHNTYLGNGESLYRVTRLVPKGRGPFKDWNEGAIDALKLQLRNNAISNFDTSLGFCLYFLEGYNGRGYANMGLPSPYLWSFSDQYHSGKFVETLGTDGLYHVHYDPKLVSQQVGAACILKSLGVFA